MTARLREALHETADLITPYELYHGALARSRRHRRRRWATAAAAAALAVVLGAALPLAWSRHEAVPVSPSAPPPSLPDRVGAPLWGTASVAGSPLGPASVVFGAPNWWFDGSKGVVAVVGGAAADTYRLVDNRGHFLYAGEQAILSPDGRRLAGVGWVTDLGTGTAVALPALGGEVLVPQAWSPDGRSLAVIAYEAPYADQPDGVQVPSPVRATLHLVDVGSGTHHRIGDLVPRGVHDGYTVAFSPDGTRLAYQSAKTITVAALDGTVINRMTTDAGSHLAGKGAWTPNGQGLTLVRQRQCCDGDAYPSRWQLTVVDPATGEAQPTPSLAELSGLVAVRLLGWSPSGEAVVAAFYPEPGTSVVGFDTAAETLALSHGQFTAYEWVRAAKVLAVGPDATQRTLLSAPQQQMLSVDVADNVIANGQGRTGHPPQGIGPYFRTILIGAAVVSIATIGGLITLTVVVRRAHRRKRP